MNNRAIGFVSLLAVIGVSIVFGMLLGGKLNAPQYALAAQEHAPVRLAPATTAAEPEATSFADIVEQAMPAVVSVTSTHLGESGEDEGGGQPSPEEFWRRFFGPEGPDQRQPPPNHPRIGEGSGFIISADGYILTNHHVVEEADKIHVGLQDGTRRQAEVIGTDPSIDLALIKIDDDGESLPVLPLGDSENLRVGEWVIAIGNPLEYEQTVTVGVVSAKKRRVPVGNTDQGVVSFIQTDAAINFGNSGGPLLDARGNVVGINTAIRRTNFAEGIGFALPISQARSVIEQLRDRGYVRRGYIGITMNPSGIDEEAREYYGLPDSQGVLVAEVAEDGPAEKAGLKAGDIIRKVNDDKVRDNMDLIGKIASQQPGDSVSLEVFRRGKMLDLEAKLVDREEELERLSARTGGSSPPRRRDDDDSEAEGLGIKVRPLSDRMRESLGLDAGQRGVMISDVDFDSEAREKQLAPNMVVIAINDSPIRDLDDWTEAIGGLRPGTPVKLDLLVGSRTRSVFLRAAE